VVALLVLRSIPSGLVLCDVSRLVLLLGEVRSSGGLPLAAPDRCCTRPVVLPVGDALAGRSSLAPPAVRAELGVAEEGRSRCDGRAVTNVDIATGDPCSALAVRFA